MIAGIRADLGIKLFGDDLEVLKDKAAEIERVVKKIPGAADVATEQITGPAGAAGRGRPRRPVALRRLGAAGARRRRDGGRHQGRRDPASRSADSRWSSACRCRTATTRRALEKILITTASRPAAAAHAAGHAGGDDRPVDDPARVGPAADRRPGQRPRPRHRLVRQGGPGADRPRGRSCRPATRSSGAASSRTCSGAERRLLIVVPLALALILSLLYLTFHSLRDAADDLQRRAVRPRRRRARAVGDGPAVHDLGGRRLRGPGRGVDARRAWCSSAPSATGWRTACPKREAIEQARLARLRPVLMTGTVAALGLRADDALDRHRRRGPAAAGHRRRLRHGLRHVPDDAGPARALSPLRQRARPVHRASVSIRSVRPGAPSRAVFAHGTGDGTV